MNGQISPEGYQQIFKAIPGAFLLLAPDRHFTILDASDEYLRATLRTRAGIQGLPVFDAFPDNPATPDAASTLNLSRSLNRVLTRQTTDVMAIQRYDVPCADGGFALRYWSPVNAPVFADDGSLLYIVHRVDNVTEYVQLQQAHARQVQTGQRLSSVNARMEAEILVRSQELARLNVAFRETNDALTTLAAQAVEDNRRKDDFLAMLSHELGNPLNALSSTLQLWERSAPDRKRTNLLDICKRQLHHLRRMTDDLLEMSRLGRHAVALQLAPLDLRDVIEGASFGLALSLARQKLTLKTSISPAHYHVVGDATRLEQALANVLANAAKYSKAGGTIELRMQPAPGCPGWFQIDVADQGRGIAADQLEAIFELFVQADAQHDRGKGGLGIGLALVRAIVELHGGTIRAHSAGLGLGSCFTILLPPAPPPAHGSS